jgi:hypothetical protein
MDALPRVSRISSRRIFASAIHEIVPIERKEAIPEKRDRAHAEKAFLGPMLHPGQ